MASRIGVKGPCKASQIHVFYYLIPLLGSTCTVYSDTLVEPVISLDYLSLIKTVVCNVFLRNPEIPRLIILTEASV